MTDQTKINSKPGSRWQWPMVSVVLLIVYLAFFHLCLGANYGRCIATGFVCWIIWMSICLTVESVKNVFTNRFEYWIHQLVGLDILFEGFNPVHEGYGFYFCATGFWVIFLINHYVFAPLAKRKPQPSISVVSEEVALTPQEIA